MSKGRRRGVHLTGRPPPGCLGAVEKQKLVYILNRDAAAHLTISSPLEAHKSHSMIYDMTGIDVGFENPVFACLELDYENVDEDPSGEALELLAQTLTFYELDLGTAPALSLAIPFPPLTPHPIHTLPAPPLPTPRCCADWRAG
jgi:hypothetical protein